MSNGMTNIISGAPMNLPSLMRFIMYSANHLIEAVIVFNPVLQLWQLSGDFNILTKHETISIFV